MKNFILILVSGFIATKHLKQIIICVNKFNCVGIIDNSFQQAYFFLIKITGLRTKKLI